MYVYVCVGWGCLISLLTQPTNQPNQPPQVVDLPGIIEGAKDGKGRGRQVISAARTCNIILVVLDVAKPATHKILIERELDGFGIRLNQEPPRITFRRKEKGGINYQVGNWGIGL